jgi:hypothetical protein
MKKKRLKQLAPNLLVLNIGGSRNQNCYFTDIFDLNRGKCDRHAFLSEEHNKILKTSRFSFLAIHVKRRILPRDSVQSTVSESQNLP